MPRTARKQRRQPYAWLGASAVTLGLGAAMVGGAAVAAADTTTDAGGAATASAGPASPDTASSSTASRRAPRGGRSGAGPAAARPSRAAAALTTVADTIPAAATPGVSAGTSSAAPAAVMVAPRSRAARPPAVAAAPSGATASVSQAAVTPQTDTAVPAATVEPVDPPYIPNTIVPGAHVALALNEIPASQATLNQATWGAGNYAAALVAIVPQLFLAEAQLSLTLWQNNMPGAQQVLAATAGIPIIQQLAELNLYVTAALPTFTQIGLTGASVFMPLVGLLGAATAPTQTLIDQARSDGTVYAVTLVQMKSVVEPVITGSIGGGGRTQMLVDTGSSGMVTTLDQLGPNRVATDQTGTIIYSGASDTPFNYRVYQTTVDFGGGAVTGTTYVDVIEDTPEQEAAFKDFVNGNGANVILGTGASAVGPGPGYLPTTQLPGELSDGYLLNENIFLGLFGVMIFGPNLYPARVSVPGSPYAQLQVQIGSNAKQPVTDAIIDSGGVYGTLPASLFTNPTIGDQVPAGTKISVYTQDGQTLLYSYTTNSANGPYIIADDPFGMDVNTGYIPFSQQVIYTDYSASTYPDGATVFDIT